MTKRIEALQDLDSDEALSGAVVPPPKADAAVTSYQADLST